MTDISDVQPKSTFRQLSDSAVIAVVSTIVTALIQITSGFIFGKNGTIAIGPPIQIHGTLYQEIDIWNHQDNPILDLSFNVPIYTKIGDIFSTFPISVKFVENNASIQTREIGISGIPGRALTRILVPIDKIEDSIDVQILNYDSKHLSVENVKELHSKIYGILWNISLTLMLYLFLVFIVQYIGFRVISNLEIKIQIQSNELRENLKQDRDDFEKK